MVCRGGARSCPARDDGNRNWEVDRTSGLGTLDRMTTGVHHRGDGHTPNSGNARLRAIVAVDGKDRVRCQQPGSGHSVYAAVHVVEEDGKLMVLGSTCFAQRYGSPAALGQAQYGGGGGGRKLTDEERQLLIENTEALLAQFEAQAIADAEAAALAEAQTHAEELLRKQQIVDKLTALRAAYAERQAVIPGMAAQPSSPWPWQMERSSVAVFTAPDGAHWVRVQHKDRSQKLVPWPHFPGWESALPSGIGRADPSIGAIAVNNIADAIQILRQSGFLGPEVGRWQDVLPRNSTRPVR